MSKIIKNLYCFRLFKCFAIRAHKNCTYLIAVFCCGVLISLSANAQGTRLLRQPTISDTHIAFVYGGDIWVTELGKTQAVRITSTAAVESDPHFSPDGQTIAFTSNRSGTASVYTVSVNGGAVNRLTWHPSPVITRGWTPDGERVLYASSRGATPIEFNRLWTVAVDGGGPSLLSEQWGYNGAFSPAGNQIIIDRMTRRDVEWRSYRGGQNTPLVILDLDNESEIQLPNESSVDIEPIWIGDNIYFLSDRDWTSNIWSYSPGSNSLRQITEFSDSDIKQLAGNDQLLTFEHDGYLYTLDPDSNETIQLEINVIGDFPWAETKWEDVSENAESASLSPTGKRAIMAARGEVFTVPVENGDTRNITQTSGAADRAPLWSPLGDKIAWFSDNNGESYRLIISSQDGMSSVAAFSIGESTMAWEPTWSPDGQLIAFVDDDVRIRVIDIGSGEITTVDVGGTNIERGSNGLAWSPDSNWLAYSKTGRNGFRRITVWSRENNEVNPLTNAFADSFSPSWDRNGEHLYFLASTDVALGSSWASTSAIASRPEYAAYIINLSEASNSPFEPLSDEEVNAENSSEESDSSKEGDSAEDPATVSVTIDIENIERRTLALPLPARNYRMTVSGPSGSVFIGEKPPNNQEMVLQKFTLEGREARPFIDGVSSVSVSADGNSLLVNKANAWQIIDAGSERGYIGENANGATNIEVNLTMRLDREAEWKQMFDEAWRYERDYFYDPNMHGRDWDDVYRRYAPLVPFIKHRSALSYILDQVNGEMSVGHSFVRGGDYPEVEESTTGLLGVDLIIERNRWKIERIYTSESWNPELTGPLDQPGLNIQEGYYLVGINGRELSANENPYVLLEGTADQQTVLHVNDSPNFENAWQETVVPIRNENSLRQRTWVEDNRRMVDELSDGKLGYIWVPNTTVPGLVSFNRYFFAQQDKAGAVIDERYNGGGQLDDYMVDLMTRSLRVSITNEVPNGSPMRIPAGILGPKVLMVNEMSMSGGDFFAWVFRQQQAGPLLGQRTWGGLVKSSVHYSLVDGGILTAPDNAIFDPIANQWVAENEGITPDIEVYQDAISLG
ncbi:PD40 domain-containing protein, partial [Gammaproteobacteria bacterium AH-315-E17]|nr:PD40 domain-containing protein [Gammaproteobacteria bacterium AH-315-E17]